MLVHIHLWIPGGHVTISPYQILSNEEYVKALNMEFEAF